MNGLYLYYTTNRAVREEGIWGIFAGRYGGIPNKSGFNVLVLGERTDRYSVGAIIGRPSKDLSKHGFIYLHVRFGTQNMQIPNYCTGDKAYMPK